MVSVTITKDMSAGKVAKLLERKGLVESADVFKDSAESDPNMETS